MTLFSLKILLQRVTYFTIEVRVIKNECKVEISSKYLIKKISSNEKISYTVVWLIMHDGNFLYFGHYVSDVFDANTGIWWHCDDFNITDICDSPKGIYTIEIY